jgi:hypothetical protein
MNRVILTAIVATCLAGTVLAGDTLQVSASQIQNQNEFNEMWTWLIEYNNFNKDAAAQVFNEMEQKIRQEFPMDPKLQQTLDALIKEQYAALEAKAKELGYSNYKDAYNSPNGTQMKIIEGDYQNRINTLRSDYDKEFHLRYQNACIEAVKRLQENANAMK